MSIILVFYELDKVQSSKPALQLEMKDECLEAVHTGHAWATVCVCNTAPCTRKQAQTNVKETRSQTYKQRSIRS